jgi:TrmH family RNA methyltransferase
MKIISLTSLQNPNVKEAVGLRERRNRDQADRFLIEGYRELFRAVQAGIIVQSLYICPSLFLGNNEKTLISQIASKGATIYECTEKVFQKLSYRDRPDGLLAVAPQMHKNLSDLDKLIKKKKNPFIVVAEAIEKPGNLGTILRSCDAVGVDALIVCDRCTDIHNPNVVRASVGTLFTISVVEAEGKETLSWLQEQQIGIAAATPSAVVNYTEADFRKPTAIAVGTEQYGLSDLWMEKADIKVRIPMKGIADSLNVATATTVLLYEVLRQRS